MCLTKFCWSKNVPPKKKQEKQKFIKNKRKNERRTPLAFCTRMNKNKKVTPPSSTNICIRVSEADADANDDGDDGGGEVSPGKCAFFVLYFSHPGILHCVLLHCNKQEKSS